MRMSLTIVGALTFSTRCKSQDTDTGKESTCESFSIPIFALFSAPDVIRGWLISVLCNQVSWLIVAVHILQIIKFSNIKIQVNTFDIKPISNKI